MAHLHPVHPVPTYVDGTPTCKVEFGYKTVPINGLCYVLGKPIAQSTWEGGSLWAEVPIKVPTYNFNCPAGQPKLGVTSASHDPAIYGFEQGSQ
jgi:hypothetical protein